MNVYDVCECCDGCRVYTVQMLIRQAHSPSSFRSCLIIFLKIISHARSEERRVNFLLLLFIFLILLQYYRENVR